MNPINHNEKTPLYSPSNFQLEGLYTTDYLLQAKENFLLKKNSA